MSPIALLIVLALSAILWGCCWLNTNANSTHAADVGDGHDAHGSTDHGGHHHPTSHHAGS